MKGVMPIMAAIAAACFGWIVGQLQNVTPFVLAILFSYLTYNVTKQEK